MSWLALRMVLTKVVLFVLHVFDYFGVSRHGVVPVADWLAGVLVIIDNEVIS